ncbi:vesicle-associated membrane protein 4 [Plakobranchus ocellatus]|uniref:Vesicle-associated membrane protein 4 n=1 Tax=Plakobranchus ocellatus TaxID=259542 RepID=A0AAV3ZS36_9GAST|nr:vesicle-associated membrane protein 4 [Plakobranchus ocellatus]
MKAIDQREFKKALQLYQNMARASRGRTDNLDHLEGEVSEVTALLKDNVEKVVGRGERIDALQSRSEDLEHSSSHFRSSAKKLKRKMWWKNCKLMCLIILIVLVIIGVIVAVILVETKPWESGHSKNPNNTLTKAVERFFTDNPSLTNSSKEFKTNG